MVVLNRPSGIDPKGVVSFCPDGESRKNAFWTQLDEVRQPGFLPCLEKPTQNGGMKPTSWNRSQGCCFVSPRWGKSKKRVLNAIGRRSSTRLFAMLGKAHSKWWYETDLVEFDPKGVFSFPPMGKVEKTRFERNWTTFVNPAFCPAWKSPLKMVVWNRPRGIRSQGCCFVSPIWGKSKKRVLNAIRRRSSTRLFALLGKAHSKWWYETDLVESIPRVLFRFAPMGKVEKTRFERNWTTFANPAFCPAWKSPLKMVVWNQPRGIRSQGCCFVSPRWGKSKKRVLNAIRGCCFVLPRRSSTRLFALLGKAQSKWWYETDLVESIPRVLFRFAPMGKVEKTRFERSWTRFVNRAFCPAWKSPLKMVVWNRPRGIRSQGCCFVSPWWGKSKKRVLNAIGRRSSTRLFALLGKPHSKWWYETDLVVFDPKGFFSFRPDGESRKNAFWTQLDDVRQPGFLPCLEKPTQNGGMKPTSWNSILRVFFSFRPDGESRKNAFWTQLDDVRQPGFLPCLEKPRLKMVVWNRPRGIRSQGCCFVSPRWGKSKKRVLNAIGRRSSTRLFALLGKAHSKWWYETDLVEFDPKGVASFRPDEESRKNAFERNWTTFVNPPFCPAWKSPLKMVVWNRRPGIRS